MGLGAAAWCLVPSCQEMPQVVITVERNGILAHHGACWDHVEVVAARVRRDFSGQVGTSSPNVSPERFDHRVVESLDVRELT